MSVSRRDFLEDAALTLAAAKVVPPALSQGTKCC